MELLLATTNEGKVAKARSVLSAYGITVKQLAIDVPEPKSLDLEETIRAKALAAYRMVGKPLAVEDTGLFFDAYSGFPGTYSKFAIQTIGMVGVLKLLEGKPRGAEFKTAVAYIAGESSRDVHVFIGSMRGSIADAPRGGAHHPQMPYKAVFVPQGESRTLSETGGVPIDHRAIAFRQLGEWLSKQGVGRE